MEYLALEVITHVPASDGVGKTPATLRLETTARRRGESLVPYVGSFPAALDEYDLLLETIADAPSQDKASASEAMGEGGVFARLAVDPEDVATLSVVRAGFLGARCPTQQHAEVRVSAVTEVRELPDGNPIVLRSPGASVVTLKPLQLNGPKIPFEGLVEENSIAAVFAFVASFFQTKRPKEIALEATGCGIRAPDDPKSAQPIRQLNALLRVYRRDKWTVGLKIPSLGTYSHKAEATDFRSLSATEPKGDYSRETNWSAGVISSKSEEQREGKTTTRSEESWVLSLGVKETLETHSKGQGRRTESSTQYSFDVGEGEGDPVYGLKEIRNSKVQRRRGKPKRSYEEIHERLTQASGFDIVVAHNDMEIEAQELLDFIGKLAGYLADFGEALVKIRDVFNKVPQVGWTFDFEIKALTGIILLEYAPRQLTEPTAHGRYIPVEYRAKGKIALEIVDMSLELTYGVEAQGAGTGVTATVKGTISFKASVEHDISLDLLNPRQRWEVENEGKVDLTALANGKLLGLTLYEIKGSVSSGLELEGAVTIDLDAGSFDLKGDLRYKPVLITGGARGPDDTMSRPIDPPIQVLEGGVLYSFT